MTARDKLYDLMYCTSLSTGCDHTVVSSQADALLAEYAHELAQKIRDELLYTDHAGLAADLIDPEVNQ